MQRLCLIGWKVNAFDYDGRTALLVAISEGHLQCVKYLVQHGARIDHKDFRGNNALDEAKRCGHTAIYGFLASLAEREY
jgi:glutaminase